MDMQQDNYRAAYFEASEELKRIYREFEELSNRREKLDKVIEALQPRLGPALEDETDEESLTTQLDDFKVVTRVYVSFKSESK